MGTLLEDLCKYMIISCWTLLRIINFSNNSCRENQNFLFSVSYFWKSSLLWGNVDKYCTAR